MDESTQDQPASQADGDELSQANGDQLILLAAYADMETAKVDFDEINTRIKKGLDVRAVAMVSKDENGQPMVAEAYNRHGRIAAGFGLGIGTLLGLFVPPLLLSMMVGAAVGAAAVSFAEHEMRLGLRKEIGAALEEGTAVIVSLAHQDSRMPIQSTLTGADEFRALQMDEATVTTLEETVAEEMRKIAPTGKTGTNS
jgi:uncharacterized membrane protein